MFEFSLNQSKPKMALVFHIIEEKSNEQFSRHSHCENNIVVTEHGFEPSQSGGYTMLGATKVVDPSKFVEIIDSLDRQRKVKKFKEHNGWIDSNLIYQSSKMTVWFVPPGKRTIVFTRSSEKKETQAQKAEVDFLPMIFVKSNGLSVFYINPRGARNDWKLYVPKLPNVYANGAVCMGNAQLTQAQTEQDRQANEQAFFSSTFSHSNMGEVIWGSFNDIVTGVRKPNLRQDCVCLKQKGTKSAVTLAQYIEQMETGE